MSPWTSPIPFRAVPLIRPLIVAAPGAGIDEVAHRAQVDIAGDVDGAAAGQGDASAPWQMRLPVMVVVPAPEMDSAPLLALVIVPLMVSFWLGSPSTMEGTRPPESAVMVMGTAPETIRMVSVLSEVSRVMADTWAAGMVTVDVPAPVTNPAPAPVAAMVTAVSLSV